VRYVALWRGINVGRAKRIAMADLRALLEGLGFDDVRTLLNSGNAVFSAEKLDVAASASRIEAAVQKKTGVAARVTLMTATELARAVRENPLAGATHPSRLLVAFLYDKADRERLVALANDDWAPEQFALGKNVAYLACTEGILESKVAAAVEKALRKVVTARNWATVLKLHAIAVPRSPSD
jgi:uncharacterized protein (DUF1697 family)